MFNQSNKQKGFFKIIILVIIAIIILSYFGFDLRAIIESPETQGNLGYVWGLVVTVWNNYLSGPILYLWNDIFIDLLWDSFIDNMNRLKNHQTTTIEDLAPQVP